MSVKKLHYICKRQWCCSHFKLGNDFFFYSVIRNHLKVTILPLDFYVEVFIHQIYVKLHFLDNYRGLDILSQKKYLFSICVGCFDALNPNIPP